MSRHFGWLAANHPPSVSLRSKAHRVVLLCGGFAKLSRALGHRWPTTVQGWSDRGVIPARQVPNVIAAAKALGIELSLDDFFDTTIKAA